MHRSFLLLLSMLLLAGCSTRDLPTPPTTAPVVLKEVLLPEKLGAQQLYRIEIAVSGAADSVRLEAAPLNAAAPERTLYLYDDGGARHSLDGDRVAFDGIFTQLLHWQPAAAGGQEYRLHFQALQGGQSAGEPLEEIRRSGDLSAPVLTRLILPDTLQSGFSGLRLLQAMVTDSSGASDVARVEVRGSATGKAAFDTLLYDDGTHGDITAADGLFTLAVDRTFCARKSGAYTFAFTAVDKSGLKSAVRSAEMVLVNGAPLLIGLSAPESVTRPASGISTHLVTIQVEEPQGLQDVNRVLLRAYNPDGSGFNNNPFVMYDNGLALDINRWDLGYRGDQVARDGVYSMTVIFDASKALGAYRLTFVAEDWAGQQSELVTHSIMLE
ncbi:MAG TPA: hypothetical protein PKI62_00575 [bacterium]|mgnify:CR=1 FL=1|nr:hypothetical protein [bacterium]HPR88790.1 hypothetical protein [bacterium]